MTFYHFLNCALLAYGPLYVVYKGNNIAEDGLSFLCVKSGLYYIMSQMMKMILIATFIPVSNVDSFHLAVELRRIVISMVDVGAVYLIFTQKINVSVERKKKEVAIGLGWSIAEAILSVALPLFNGARGNEFSWKYIQLCVGSNISIVGSIGFATLVSMLSFMTKKSSPSSKSVAFGPTVILLLWHLASIDMIPGFCRNVMLLDAWVVLALQGGIALFVLFAARFLSSSSSSKQD